MSFREDQSNPAASESWWAALDDLKSTMERRLQEGDERMTALQAGVDENTELTKKIDKNTAEIVDIMGTLKSLLKVCNALSTVAVKIWKPISYISATFAALGSLYLAWKSSGK
jgi:hypothetical protein